MFIAIGLSAPPIRNHLGMVLLVLLVLAANPVDSTAVFARQVEAAEVGTYDLRGDCFGGKVPDGNPLADVELRLFLVDKEES